VETAPCVDGKLALLESHKVKKMCVLPEASKKDRTLCRRFPRKLQNVKNTETMGLVVLVDKDTVFLEVTTFFGHGCVNNSIPRFGDTFVVYQQHS